TPLPPPPPPRRPPHGQSAENPGALCQQRQRGQQAARSISPEPAVLHLALHVDQPVPRRIFVPVVVHCRLLVTVVPFTVVIITHVHGSVVKGKMPFDG